MHHIWRHARRHRGSFAGAAAAAASCTAAVAVAGSADLLAVQQPGWQSVMLCSRSAMCAAATGTSGAHSPRMFQVRGANAEIQLAEALDTIASKQLVILGEVHGNSTVVDLQRQVQQCMIRDPDQKVHVVLEHFSFAMQHLPEDYAAGNISLGEMAAGYHKIGTENHDIQQYERVPTPSHISPAH